MAETEIMESLPVEPIAGPDLIRVVGALIYGSPEPVTVRTLRKILRDVASNADDNTPEAALVNVGERDIRDALETLRLRLEQQAAGIHLVEIADGFRFFTDPECSPWLRHVLQTEKPARLSRPALETLAIIAYRQPVARSEIEAVRGVSVDHVVRNLMEFQLVRIVGRSELPGRPLLYGTTQRFLEHFGLKDLRELPGIDELARRDRGTVTGRDESTSPATETQTGDEPPPPDSASDREDPAGEDNVPSAHKDPIAGNSTMSHVPEDCETTAGDPPGNPSPADIS